MLVNVKKHRLLSVFLGLVVLTGCSSGTSSDAEGGGSRACPAVGDLTVVMQQPIGSEARCIISGTLTQSARLGDEFNWYLDGIVRVNRVTADATTLTIESGTHIRGDTQDALYIAPGASLVARGTGGSPIIFSSNDDVDLTEPGGGKWGGLILDDTGATGRISMQYVIVADAGEAVDIDGITYNDNLVLIGDHDDTSMRFIQSHDSARDGIRLEGSGPGNLNQARMDWVLITGATRDGLSYENFSGLVKDLLVIHRVDSVANVVGRAGIYASGSEEPPLIINASLIGRDTQSASPGSTSKETGIIFDNTDTSAITPDRVRFANVLIANFRHGCYQVESNSDLSGVGLTEPSFIDGLHCSNEFADTAPNVQVDWVLRAGAVNFDRTGINNEVLNTNGDEAGAHFYGAAAINFAGGSSSFTGSWYLEGIGSFDNGLVGASGNLNAYNNGDTNNSGGAVTSDDIDYEPLLDSADPFFGPVNPASLNQDSEGYDLTHVGAIRSSISRQFNGWTLQDRALSTNVTGFSP